MRARNIPLSIAMLEAGLTQQELAKQVGLSPTAVSNIVTLRSKPKLATAMSIANAVERGVESLFGKAVAQ